MRKVYEERQDCCGCGACKDICPVGAIRMASDQEGFWYPQVDASRCIDCGRCEKVCPVKHSEGTDPAGETLYCFGGRAEEDGVREQSSSGGIFPLLAEYVLSRQGFVYGAAYNEQMEVVHGEASSMAELDALKRTKYVQSNMEGVYQKIEERLKEGSLVLFVGTPCQTHALRLFLGREYPALIVVSLICYGVPSPGVWRFYVEYLEQKFGGKMTSFSFRDKRMQDNGHTCAFVIDGREHATSLYQDPYCGMYFANAILRPSCHACKFCTTRRDSDFTIGDFWGIEKVRPDMDDGMGTSVVLLHSERASQVFEEVKGKLAWFACEKKDVLQPRLLAPTPAWKRRGRFWFWYGKLPFSLFQRLFMLCRHTGALWGRFRKK